MHTKVLAVIDEAEWQSLCISIEIPNVGALTVHKFKTTRDPLAILIDHVEVNQATGLDQIRVK